MLLCLQVAAKSTFFEDHIGMFSLNDTEEVLRPFCSQLLARLGAPNVNAPASSLGPQYAAVSASAMEQCLVEQRYVRGAQLRTLIYNQVSQSILLLLLSATQYHSVPH